MTVLMRWLLMTLSIVIVAVAIVIWIEPRYAWLAVIAALAGAGIILVLLMRPGESHRGPPEPQSIDLLTNERRLELMRGTSLYLQQQEYRYSIRAAREESRLCFTADVNTVKLGFVPAIVTDNTNDRQGYGYVAFVYDGRRWRGPGLPCPDGQAEAVRHAARCVSPLATDDETRYEQGTSD
jgi:hypothetical protein